jgi:hypothetical protein
VYGTGLLSQCWRVNSGIAKLWELSVAGVLAYLWNVWSAARRWYGTGKRLPVSSATGGLECGASRSGERPDVSRRAELEAFLGWVMGTSNQSSLTSFGTARSFPSAQGLVLEHPPANPGNGRGPRPDPG